MQTFTKQQLLGFADRLEKRAFARKTASAPTTLYDVFISHSYSDRVLAKGIYDQFFEWNYIPYIDWICDPFLNREDVTDNTAEVLRRRMRNSKVLIYVTSENHIKSRWMPWECGFMDGIKSKVAILPATENVQSNFTGQEYLGLYPWLGIHDNCVHVADPKTNSMKKFDDWIRS